MLFRSHAARAAGRRWLLFTTVGFVAHCSQHRCFAASCAPIWTSAAILAADPHLWLRQYLQEVRTWSGKTNFDHLPGHGEYFGNRLLIGAQAVPRSNLYSCGQVACYFLCGYFFPILPSCLSHAISVAFALIFHDPPSSFVHTSSLLSLLLLSFSFFFFFLFF